MAVKKRIADDPLPENFLRR